MVAPTRASLYATALRTFRRLPPPVRRGLVRVGTPSFTVGAVCAIVCDGKVIALRQPHRFGWSLPGGLLDRGEDAVAAVERELVEETGLSVHVGSPVATIVDARARRVDVVFRIEVDHCFAVTAGGEAEQATWIPLEQLAEGDGPTNDILHALQAVDGPDDPYAGDVLSR